MVSSGLLSLCLFYVIFCTALSAVVQRDQVSETSVAIPARPETIASVDEDSGSRLRRQYPDYYYYPTYTYSYYPYSSYGVMGNSYNMAGFYPHYNPIGSGSAWAAGGGLVGNTLSFLIG